MQRALGPCKVESRIFLLSMELENTGPQTTEKGQQGLCHILATFMQCSITWALSWSVPVLSSGAGYYCVSSHCVPHADDNVGSHETVMNLTRRWPTCISFSISRFWNHVPMLSTGSSFCILAAILDSRNSLVFRSPTIRESNIRVCVSMCVYCVFVSSYVWWYSNLVAWEFFYTTAPCSLISFP